MLVGGGGSDKLWGDAGNDVLYTNYDPDDDDVVADPSAF